MKPRCVKLASLLALALPLVMSSAAHADALPNISVTPSQVEFGDVADGTSASQAVTFVNNGSTPAQLQLLFLEAGTPSVWSVENDGCSGVDLQPGDSCQIELGFAPDEVGYRDGALVITQAPGKFTQQPVLQQASATAEVTTVDDSAPQPCATLNPIQTCVNAIANGNPALQVVGFSGTGLPNPNGSVTITGNRAAGSTLTCDPSGDPPGDTYSYRWMRNGQPMPSATNSTLPLFDSNVGQSFSCQVVDTNPVGSVTLTSAPTGPVAPMALTLQPGAFTDEGTCRAVDTSHLLRVGRNLVSISSPDPVTPWSELALWSRSALSVSIDGRRLALGRRIAITPQTLSSFGDGLHSLEVNTGGGAATTPLVLLPCSLAVRVQGGAGQGSTLSASSLYGMRKLTFRLPSGLHIDAQPNEQLGWVTFKSAYYPTRLFNIIGGRTTWNNVVVTVARHTVSILNLPIETGVATVTLRGGVLKGRPGIVKLTALERGERAMTLATTPATWLP